MKSLFIILLSFFILSCNNSSNENSREKQNSTQIEEYNHSNETLHLNKNHKWKVVPDMMNYIRYMNDDVTNFKGTTVDDYQNLATDLLINIDLLTANCTMKGDAHDQLHLWLLPFIDQVNSFANSKNLVDKSEEYLNIQQSFLLFNKYFH